MDAISWYALGKTVLDATTVMEEIDDKILTHNLDGSAHGQSNEAVYNHRIAELLDHVSYSIYNVKVNPAARIYKAIVGPGFEADFTTIQQAIDWAHLYGGGIVHIKAGTYTQTDNITMYSDITLEGEDDDTSIIDFATNYKHIIIQGTSGTHKKNITFQNLQFYRAGDENGAIYLEYADDIIIQDCYFHDNFQPEEGWGEDIYMTGVNSRIHIRRNRFIGGRTCIYLGNAREVWIEYNYFYNNATFVIRGASPQKIFISDNSFDLISQVSTDEGGIYFEASVSELTIESNFFYHCAGVSIWVTNGDHTIIANNRCHGTTNSYEAIDISGSHGCTITGNVITGYNTSGIFLYDSDDNTIVGNVSDDNTEYGINIYNNTCDRNVIVGNSFRGNGSGGIKDVGTGTVKTGNYP